MYSTSARLTGPLAWAVAHLQQLIVPRKRWTSYSSFPNDIGTALTAHPDLVTSAGIDVDARPGTKGLLGRGLIVRILNGQLPLENEMRRQAAVLVRRVVCIAESLAPWIRDSSEYTPAVCPGEDVVEAPRGDFRLCFSSLHVMRAPGFPRSRLEDLQRIVYPAEVPFGGRSER